MFNEREPINDELIKSLKTIVLEWEKNLEKDKFDEKRKEYNSNAELSLYMTTRKIKRRR